jgi:hypothetical protein
MAATAWSGDRADNQGCEGPDFPFRFPHALQRVGKGSGKSVPCPSGPCATKSHFLPHILLFGPCGAHSLAPAARPERRRAQRMSMMARQRHPEGPVIDRSEHAGSFGQHGVRTGEVNTPAPHFPRRNTHQMPSSC